MKEETKIYEPTKEDKTFAEMWEIFLLVRNDKFWDYLIKQSNDAYDPHDDITGQHESLEDKQ